MGRLKGWTWQNKRRRVWRRDGGICQVCGMYLELDQFVCGHLIDRSEGGSNDMSNLVVMCEWCDRAKPKHRTHKEYRIWQQSMRQGLWREGRYA